MRKLILSIRLDIALGLWLASAAAMAQGPWAESYQLESRGAYGAASRVLVPVIEVNPEHEFAILRMAWLKYLEGDYNASITDYRRARDLNKQSLEAQLGLTLPFLAQRRWREAAAAAQEVLSAAPWNYYAHVRLMAAEEGQRRWQTLASHAREVAARYPSDATILVYLARAEARQGNLDVAIDVYANVLERVPTHEEATAFLAENGK